MKFKFTKLAALLLAGAALLAVGCTDYEVDIQKVDKKVDELAAKTAADLDAQVNALKAMITTLEQNYKDADSALKQQLEGQIQDLQNLKLDKSTFEQYKSETAQTLKLLNDAIQEIKDDYATKEELQAAVADISAKLNDYVLKTTFDEFVAIAATKKELQDAKDKLEQDITDLETKLEGEITEAKQQMIEELGKLNKALEQINGDLESLDERVTLLEEAVADVIDELAFAEGDLQGYIDDAAADALEQAKAYVDDYLDYIIEQLNEILGDIYDRLAMALQRIQSIQYVPDYDDLKITSNLSVVTVPEVEGALCMDQPTKITYQFLPSQYAETIAEGIKENIEEKWTREEAKDYGYKGIVAFFNVKPVNTRADEAEEELEYGFEILDVLSADNTTGEITFLVMPKNIASAQFAANGIKPSYEYGLVSNGYYLTGWLADMYPASGIFAADEYEARVGGYYDILTVPVFNYEDIKAYEARTAFAAQLRMYHFQDYDFNEDAFEGDEIDWDNLFIDYENELASPYNVLYPAVTSEIEVLPDVYKPGEDEEGNPTLVKATPEYQYLPYTALRDDDPVIGEEEDQDPKGYRIYLDQALPAVEITEGETTTIMTIKDALKKGYNIPNYELSDKAVFSYDKGTAASVDKANFIETPDTYAEIEMNPDAELLDRFAAVGNVIKGTYTVAVADSDLPPFDVYGEVEITKSLGSVDVNATIVWDYDGYYLDEQDNKLADADVDHENFYNDANLPYGRDNYEVTIEENDLEKNLDVTLADFSGLTPKSLKVTVTYTNDEGVEVKDEVVDDATVATLITDVAINEDKLTADFIGFKWDAVYTVTAVYELPEALITVNGTLTTIDRNREPVVLGPYEHTFIINGEELVEGENGMYYQWVSDALHPDIFKAYDGEEVINVQDNVDFLYPDKQEDFNAAELTGKLRMSPNDATKENTATPYVDVNRNEIVLKTKENFNTAALISDQFSTGERSADDPNLWVGKVVTRTVTTYIGEEIEIQMIFNYKVPDYNFLHLRYYTFNTGHEAANFITQRALPAEIDGVESPYDAPIWWTQVNPSYFTDVPAEGQTPSQADRVSNRYALADYDVAYINLAELAYNVVDENDDIIEDADMEELGLRAEFIYTDDELGDKDLPKVDQIDPDFLLYKSLWIDNTTFYYRTNEHPYIPALGKLYLAAADDPEIEFEVATRFEFPKNAVKFPSEELDYSTYAVVRWTPFKDPKAAGYTMVLDENKIYSVPLFKGMELKDNRPNGTSFYVIKDGEWVVGNAAQTATASSSTNGYMKGVKANDAYHITTTFDYSEVNLPAELKKLLTVEEIEGIPYIVFDYTSEVVFHGVVTIPVIVKLENPWQETLVFTYNFVIKGVGD